MAALEQGEAALVGIGNGRTWQDRLREGAYTSPSGVRIKYIFTDVRRKWTKRGTLFEFSGVNDGYVQPHGFGSRQYPLRCVFNGPHHDLEAEAFEAAIAEDGIGVLEHPKYGEVRNVVPFGDITRRDDLVFAANQSIVEVTFWTTLVDIYPSGNADPQSEIGAALGNFDVEAAQEFEDTADLSTAAARASTKSTILSTLGEVSDALRSASDATSSVRREFDDTYDAINKGIDVLIGQPVLLARQMINLVRAPARAAAGIQSRLDGYANLLESLISAPYSNPQTGVAQAGLVRRQQNSLVASQVMAMAAVSGSVEAVIVSTFETKPEAIAAAQDVTQLFDDLIAWREQAYLDAGLLDPGGAYQRLLQAVALTAGFLIEVSFSLVPERRITLDRPRTIVDLAAEIYGSVDDRLDLLIQSNDLSGDEILELPRGKTIAYYV